MPISGQLLAVTAARRAKGSLFKSYAILKNISLRLSFSWG
jgi:hypothetical protein